MKAGIYTTVTTLVLVLGICGWAWGGGAGIEGSKHDFSKQPWSNGESCGACHTPHRSEPPKAAPLWNPNADLKRRFGESATSASSTSKKSVLPGSGTRMCLRCHDGTLATPTIVSPKRDRFTNKLHSGIFRPAHDTSDHPVGVLYPTSDRKFRPATTVLAKGTVKLPNGRVECTSCHDPHNAAGEKKMLVASNSRSAICLTCHDK